MSGLRSSLARHVASAPAPEQGIEARRQAASRHRLVALYLDEIADPWAREVIRQQAELVLGVRIG